MKKLVPVYSFSLGTLDAQNTTPLVVDGVMYVTASHGKIYAVNAQVPARNCGSTRIRCRTTSAR